MIERIENINWEAFHFLRIEYLWVSIPVFIIIIIGLLLYAEPISWKKKISKDLQPYVILKGTEWKSRMMHGSVLLIFIFGFIAFLGPTWDQEKAPTKKIKSTLVLALDLSQSMLATDISPNRLERAKFKIQDLLEAKPRAATSLLAFSGSTHTVIPFTTDYKLILDQIHGLQPKMMPVKGTGFRTLFSKLDSLFIGNKARGKIILFTDDLSELKIETVSNYLQNNNVDLFIYPIATQMGSTIPNYNQKSILDTEKLQSLRAIESCFIIDMTLDNSDVTDLAKSISDQLVFEDNTENEEENWKDRGYIFMIPMAFLFLLCFRRGWALHLMIISLSLSSCSEENKQKVSDFSFQDLWYTQDYQAQKKYDSGDFKEAANLFSDPLRQGVSFYKAGNYSKARAAFEKDSSQQGVYNLGLTYAKLGKLDQSQEIFEKIVASDPSNSQAASNLEQIIVAKEAIANLKPEEVSLQDQKGRAENEQNKSPEDLSGGGQEATEEDMKKERLEENVETETRKGKELDELPDDFSSGKGEVPKNILMRKVDDDPALFLTRKFKYQIKTKQVPTDTNLKEW